MKNNCCLPHPVPPTMTRTDGLFIKIFVFVFVSVCLPVCLCLSVCLSRYTSLSVSLSLCLPVCLSVSLCLSVSRYTSLCVCLSLYLPVCLSVSLCVLFPFLFINAESSPERCWCGPRSQGERRGELYPTPHCHHQNDFRIKMANDKTTVTIQTRKTVR